jgi:hypothetical protein
MPQELSWNEWVGQARWTAPRPLKLAALVFFLVVAGLASGLWLTHREPTVLIVPGSPVTVSINGGQTVRDRAFIARLVADLNAMTPYPSNSVSSCPGGAIFEQDTLRFEYVDGDALTVQVNSGCGYPVVVAAYSPTIVGKATTTELLNDIVFWPAAVQ